MTRVAIDRRFFLEGFGALAASASIVGPDVALADDASDWLEVPFAPSGLILNPDNIGLLDNTAAASLAGFGMYLATAWKLTPECEVTESQLRNLFDAKTGTKPSYLAEYVNAAEAIAKVSAKLGSDGAACELLAFGVFPNATTERCRLHHFRKYVLEELARYLVANGGFRSFRAVAPNPSAINYEGYMSGPFNDPANLPYRGVDA